MSTETKVKYLDQNKVTRNSYKHVELPVSKSAWAGIIFSSLIALIVFWVFMILYLI